MADAESPGNVQLQRDIHRDQRGMDQGFSQAWISPADEEASTYAYGDKALPGIDPKARR